MNHPDETRPRQPTSAKERIESLDILRGLAILGVLIVNLHSNFRVSLSHHILTFHQDSNVINRVVDYLVAALIEFKAFGVLSLLFGIGMAAFLDRSGRFPERRHEGLLARRLLGLLAIGLVHLLIVWNGDILTLYALCGFVLFPAMRLPILAVLSLGIAAVVHPRVIPLGFGFPTDETLRRFADEAHRVYTSGSMGDVFQFHLQETRWIMLELLASVAVRTWGLMAIGASVWRLGIVRNPERHSRLLRWTTLIGVIVGGTTTAIKLYSSSTGRPALLPASILDVGSSVPLALAYSAGLLQLVRIPELAKYVRPFGAVGRMALTNYLAQSVMLSVCFYGYGLGLYGTVGSAKAVGIGLVIYAGQLVFSLLWLRRFEHGPAEWTWRRMTYGQWPSLIVRPGH
jgi:uncharacterized protein